MLSSNKPRVQIEHIIPLSLYHTQTATIPPIPSHPILNIKNQLHTLKVCPTQNHSTARPKGRQFICIFYSVA